MKNLRSILAMMLVAALFAGCTSLKNLTGSNDDTVLPGSREDVLPPDQQTARDPVVTGEQQSDDIVSSPQQSCDPASDTNCIAPIDQEATAPENQ